MNIERPSALLRRIGAWTDRHPLYSVLGMSVLFWCLCMGLYWNLTGPVFPGDEIGYLTKAAVFGGYHVDASSSFYGGYALLIAPLFRLLHSPVDVWRGVVAVNAFLLATGFVLLLLSLRRLFPRARGRALVAAAGVTMLYPVWTVFSGYAFVTPAFACVFMAVVWSTLRIRPARLRTVMLPSVLIGYLCWVHPIGLVVALAWLASMAIVLRRNGWRQWIVGLVIIAALACAYRFAVAVWLDRVMDMAPAWSDAHYADILSALSRVLRWQFVPQFLAFAAGQLAASVVATFGLSAVVLAAGASAARRMVRRRIGTSGGVADADWAVLFLAASLVGVIVAGSVNFYLSNASEQVTTRADFWVYGRYAEMLYVPVIGTGFLLSWRRKRLAAAAALVLAVGAVFALTHVGRGNREFNYIDVVAFWPHYLFPGSNRFLLWFAAGTAGLVPALLGRKRLLVALAAVGFVVTLWFQMQTRINLVTAPVLRPTVIETVIRQTLTSGSCVGYGDIPTGFTEPRSIWLRLSRFYLYDYNLRAMTVQAWLGDTHCSMYITGQIRPFAHAKGITIVTRNDDNNLYLVAKSNGASR